MKSTAMLVGGIVLGFGAAVALGLSPIVADDDKGKGHHGHDHDHGHSHAAGDHDVAPEEAAMMAAWEAYMTPGPMQKRLEKQVGDWDLEVKMFVPGMPPTTSEAKATYSMGMGGRYLFEKVTGDFNGMPFEGMGVTGYDNALKKYVWAWIDSAGTGIMHGTGVLNDAKTTMKTTAYSVNPMTGEKKKTRGKEHWVDADTKVAEMWDTMPDGTEFKAMEITYTRAKAHAAR